MNPETGYQQIAGPERRADYRLHYPPALRPLMWVGESQYEVLDISEQGVRFRLPEGSRLRRIGEPFQAKVQFHTEGLDTVSGQIVRVERGAAAARLLSGPNFKMIACEFDWVMGHLAMDSSQVVC